MGDFDNFPAVVFQYSSRFPDDELMTEDSFTENIGFEVIHLKTKSGNIFYSLEWAVPTFIGVQILRPYFESILKEAGKEHYEILKKVLKRGLLLGKKHPVTVVNEYGTVKSTFSNSISFSYMTKDEKSLKILFNTVENVNDWENYMLDIVELISDNIENYPMDKLSNMLMPFSEKKYSDTIFLIRDQKTGEIRLKDRSMMLDEYKNKNDKDE